MITKNDKIVAMNERLEKQEAVIGMIKNKFDILDNKVNKIETKVDGLDLKVDGLNTKFDTMLNESQEMRQETQQTFTVILTKLEQLGSNLERKSSESRRRKH